MILISRVREINSPKGRGAKPGDGAGGLSLLSAAFCFLFLCRNSSHRCQGTLSPDGTNGDCFPDDCVLGKRAVRGSSGVDHRTLARGLPSE